MQMGPSAPQPPQRGLMAQPEQTPVPLGGTPEGVADDIDAKLSKGEFVVPEYATNFFGMKFFHDLLKKASDGLKEMHKNGLLNRPDNTLQEPDDGSGEPTEEEAPTLAGPSQAPSGHMAHGGFVQAPSGYAKGGMVLPKSSIGTTHPMHPMALDSGVRMRSTIGYKIPHNTGVVHSGVSGPIHRDISVPKLTAHQPGISPHQGKYATGGFVTDPSMGQQPADQGPPVDWSMQHQMVKPQGLMTYPYN